MNNIPTMKLIKQFIITIFYIGSTGSLSIAQQNVTISGSSFKDAVIYKDLRPGYAHLADNNYGTYSRISSTAWTHSGSRTYWRTLLGFDLSSIPTGATIQSATLYFYSDPTNSSPNAANGNSQLSGSNAFYLEKVTSPWQENTVTWNNQPATTISGRVWVEPSDAPTENRQINIKNFVQGWIDNPASNNGIKMILENEAYYRSRNYGSTDHSNSAIHPKLVVTYDEEPDPIKDRMDHIFGALDQSYINTGILSDYGLGLVDLALFDGIITSENIMDMNSWRALYGALLSSVINPSSDLIHLKTINQALEDNWTTYDKSNPVIDIPVVFAAYQSLRDDAISENLLFESNERLHDVSGRPESPYETKYTFAAAPHSEYDKDGQVTFMFSSSIFVNSSSKIFSNFKVDFDNGAGYQSMSFGTPKNINYTSDGTKTLKFKIQFTDGSVYYSHAKFRIMSVSGAASTTRYDNTGRQDYIFPRDTDPNCPEAFPDPEAWQGTFSGATVTVEYGEPRANQNPTCDPEFIQPLIVVEGYDVSNFSAFGFNNWDYNDFAVFLDGGNNGNLNAIVPSGNFLGDELEMAGYDLIFVDLNEGTGNIIRNAYLLENIIEWVNDHKVNNPQGVREENVVLGQSMGGLIARYSVCDMEKRWNDDPANNPHHEVRLLATQDAPHRGANLPLGFQALVNELAPMKLTKIGLATYGSTGAIVGSFIEMKDIVPALEQADQLLDEPATEQMLVVQDGKTNSFLDSDYRNMVTFSSGYTPTFDMRAISNGSECGMDQDLVIPGGEIFYAEGNLYASRLLFPLAVESAGNFASTHPGIGVIAKAALYALTPFTGRNWKTKYIVRATPDFGTNEAYFGKIGFEKLILFSLPVNISLYEGSRNSASGVLPWDSAPGGYYDLQTVQASIPGNPNINSFPVLEANLTVRLANGFNFVPTVSALDIDDNPISHGALTSVYTNGQNATYPSRFGNFVTQEINPNEPNGSIHNTEHLQFTVRNAEWLFNEMQGNNQPANSCSYLCEGTPESPFISGPNVVCGDATFMISMNNHPQGSNITWNAGPNLSFPNGNTGASVTVNSGNSSSTWVEATITGDCGDFTTDRYFISINDNTPIDGSDNMEIYVDGTLIDYHSGLCNNTEHDIKGYITTRTNNSSFTFDWSFYGPDISIVSGQGSEEVTILTPFSSWGSAYVEVLVDNGCGLGNPFGDGQGFNIYENQTCGYAFMVYPVPTDDNIEVTLVETKDESKKRANASPNLDESFSIKIFDKNRRVVANASSKDRQVIINTDNLRSEIYYLQITFMEETITKKVVVN